MTAEQIKRELTRFMFDRYYTGERRVPITTLAHYTGISRGHMQDIVNGDKGIGNKTMTALGPVIEKIMDGRIRFTRSGKTWAVSETPSKDYSGAGKQEAGGAKKNIPLPKPALLDTIR